MSKKLCILAVALLAGCGELGPGDVSVPAAGSYDVIGVDSLDVLLFGVGVSGSGIVAGHIQQQTQYWKRGFRWRDGVLEKVEPSLPETHVVIAGINESGDIVGNMAPNRPFLWRAADAAPTRLFPFDTAVIALGINAQGEILLYPTLEYSPGASTWYQGEIRKLPTSAPIRPLWLTDAGHIIGEARDALSASLRFPVSPFFPAPTGWNRSARCPGQPLHADEGGRLLTSTNRNTETGLLVTEYFIDDGASCREAPKVFPGVRVLEKFTASGVYWGVREGPYSDDWDVVGRGGALVSVQSLPALPVKDREWHPQRIVAAAASGLLLASGVKTSGHGVGKPGVMLLVKRR